MKGLGISQWSLVICPLFFVLRFWILVAVPLEVIPAECGDCPDADFGEAAACSLNLFKENGGFWIGD
jgi:hypothetical protein